MTRKHSKKPEKSIEFMHTSLTSLTSQQSYISHLLEKFILVFLFQHFYGLKIVFHFLLGDRSLIQALVIDAKVTEWFSRNVSFNSKDEKG